MGKGGTGRSHSKGQEWEEDQALQGWSSRGEVWGQQGDPAPTSPPRSTPPPHPPPVSSCSSSPALCVCLTSPDFSNHRCSTYVPESPPSTPTHCPSQAAHGRASCNTASPAFSPPPALGPHLPLDRGPDHPMEWVGCCSLPQGVSVRVGSLQGLPEPQCTALPSPLAP